MQSFKVSDIVLWLWSADPSKKANRPPLTFPPLNMKTMQEARLTAACSYLHLNSIYILNKLQPSPEHHFCCLVPTTGALVISQGAGCEFSDTVMSSAHERYLALEIVSLSAALLWLYESLTRVTVELIWSSGDVMSHKLLGNGSNTIPVLRWQHKIKSRRTAGHQSSRCRGTATSPCQPWLAQLHARLANLISCGLFLTLPFPAVFCHQTMALVRHRL